MNITRSPSQTPFADLMLHPEKLEAALKTARDENDAFDASRTLGQSPAHPATPRAALQTVNRPGASIPTDTDPQLTGRRYAQFEI